MANGSRRRTPARRSRSGGGGFKPSKILWPLFLLGLLFAFFQIPHDPTVHGFIDILKAKSATVQQWITNFGDGITSGKPIDIGGGGGATDSGNGTPSGSGSTTQTPTTASISETQTQLKSLKVENAQKVSYNRDEWKQWDNVRTCWTVREEAIARQANPGSMVLLDSAGNKTTDVNSACSITSGTWIDPYTKTTITNPSKLDIDHLIPLGYVASHGGQAWSKDKKEKYANDLSETNHLIAVSASANRSKSDSGPGEWKPENKDYWCTYATAWTKISVSWSISISSSDKSALTEMLDTCKA